MQGKPLRRHLNDVAIASLDGPVTDAGTKARWLEHRIYTRIDAERVTSIRNAMRVANHELRRASSFLRRLRREVATMDRRQVTAMREHARRKGRRK